MRQLMDEYKTTINLVNQLVKDTRALYDEDVYFAGLIYSDCKKYRYSGNAGFIGICGDKLFEVVNIYYDMEEGNMHPVHNFLVSTYYKKLPSLSYGELPLLEKSDIRVSLRTIYPGMGGGNVYVLIPRRDLRDTARRLYIPTPGLGVDLESGLVIIELHIDRHRFAIKYTGREGRAYLEGNYPQGFENSPAACAITDAVVRITTDALSLYEDITNKGMKFMSIFLLY